MKTKKAAIKRLKITGSGKILRRHSSGSHLKIAKSASRIRRQHGYVRISNADHKRIRRLMPYI